MHFSQVSIHSVAHLHAPNQVSSDEISERLAVTLNRLGFPKKLLEKMTGIKNRGFWDKTQKTNQIATLIANTVIAKSGLEKSSIGAVINTSVFKDYVEPSMASIIHSNLNLPQQCFNFDITNACLGFMNGIHMAASLIETGQVDHVLVVDAENAYEGVYGTIERLASEGTTRQDVVEQLASLTLGSGAVAMILSRSDLAPNGHRIRGLVNLSASEHNKLCVATSDYMNTDSKNILKAGMALTEKAFQKAQTELGMDISQVDEFAIHQISNAHVQLFLKTFEIEPHKVMTIYQEFGNIGPVSLPLIISKLECEGRLTPGKKLAMVGVGSGLNAMLVSVDW